VKLKLNLIAQASVLAAAAALSSGAQALAIHDSDLFTTVLPTNDDGSTGPVNLGFLAYIGLSGYAQTYVNNNGNITFTGALGIFTPSAIDTGAFGPIIAPFFADVDTTNSASSEVTYGSNTLAGKKVFGVNYINVGVFDAQDILNSFQMILTDRSDVSAGDFDIQFNYDKIIWEAGEASGAPVGGLGGTSALAGYWTSDTSKYTLPGSLTNGALVDGGPNALVSHSLNSDILGQYNFQVRGGIVVTPPPVTSPVPEPETYALLMVGLGVVGWATRRRRQQA
jgi:hypothetical protein